MKRILLHLSVFFTAILTLPTFAQYPGGGGNSTDLCSGNYFATFSNGQAVNFNFTRTGYNRIAVGATYQGRYYQGSGTCDDQGVNVHVQFDLSVPQIVTHILDIRPDGSMNGYQVNGITFAGGRMGGGPGRPGGGSDLCQGTYVGAFANGHPLTIGIQRSGYQQILLTVFYMGRTYNGAGVCDLNANGAHLEFDVQAQYPVTHIADVLRDGRMSGYLTNGLRFAATKQY